MVLQKNRDAEDLEEGQALLWSYAKEVKTERVETQGKLLKYNVHRVLGWEGFLSTRGTFLRDTNIWKTCIVYWILTAMLAALVLVLHLKRSSYVMEESHLAALERIAAYSTALLGFMIATFVSNILARWWTLRDKALGGLWQAVTDTTMYLAVRLTDPADRPFLETMVRYMLLSHRLLYMETGDSIVRSSRSGKEDDDRGSDTFDHLVEVGLVTEAERRAIEGRPRMALLVWVWIDRLGRDAITKSVEKKQSDGGVCGQTRSFDTIVFKARTSIDEVFVYTTTQLPFQYVHLLSFTVRISNLLLAVKCGATMGWDLAPNTGKGIEYVSFLVQGFQIFFVPFSYHAFLRLCEDLSNPFSDSITGNNFPGFAYHCAMREECLAIIRCAHELPELPQGPAP
jgi:hypothetical protein